MKSRILAFVAAVVVATAGHGWAQETTGSIAGRVSDPQGLAVPGATVTITGPQGSQTFTADTEGRFNAPFLTPGTYTVRTELQGFKVVERRNVVVRLGQRVDLPVTMEVGGLTETVEVTGGSPTVDTSTTTVGAVINSDLLQRVPVGRRFSDALYIAPGVANSGAGAANPSIAGGSGLENQYVVDGVNITNTGYGALGSYSIYHGSLGNGVTYDFVNEIQVKTAGYEAEYGQSTGGVVNVLTKSGTNELRGSLFGYMRPTALEAEFEQVQTENGAINTAGTQTSDAGFTVGGPIFRDRSSSSARTTRAGSAGRSRHPRASRSRALERSTVTGTSTRTRERRAPSLATVTGLMRRSSAIPPRVTWDRSVCHLSSAPTRPPSARSSTGGHNQTLKYDGVLRPSWLVEATVSRAKNDLVETPSTQAFQMTDTTVVPNIVSGGVGFYEEGNEGHQPAVPGQVHTHLRWAPDPVRRRLRGHRVQQHQPVHGADFHALRRAADGDRCERTGPFRPQPRPDLPRGPGEPQLWSFNHAAVYELLRAGHLARGRPSDHPAGYPLRATEAGRVAG